MKRRGGGDPAPAAVKRPRLTEEEESRNDFAELKALGFKVSEPSVTPAEAPTSLSSSAAAAEPTNILEPPSSHPDEALTDELRTELKALEELLDLDDVGLKVAWPSGMDRVAARSRIQYLALLQPPRTDASLAAQLRCNFHRVRHLLGWLCHPFLQDGYATPCR